MYRNVLEYIENTVQKVPDKTAFADDNTSLTFREFHESIRSTGSALLHRGYRHEPVLVYMNKGPEELVAFFGIIESGCYYVPLDEEMPARRIQLIIESTKARVIICDDANRENVDRLGFSGEVILLDTIKHDRADDEALAEVRRRTIDTDPLYVLFTSGSTGVPKGVVGHHRGVIDYVEALSETLSFDGSCVFGNQSPLYFDACMKEIYPTMKFGATTWFIPHELFMLPVKLMEYLNEHKINTICWVASALTFVSSFRTFDTVRPEYLRTVAFGSEVFPVRQLNEWRRVLPEAHFYNLYGPTEATGMSCCFPVNRQFSEDEVIPVGKPFPNTDVFLLRSDNTRAAAGEDGEICIRGTCLTHGYYDNWEKTDEAFVQNPLNPYYPEKIYRTGDIGRFNEDGDLVFVSRKDYQIKHMGHRIELGEIDADAANLDGIRACCTIYSRDDEKIVMFYMGDLEKADLLTRLKERLPRYMIPNALFRLDALPLTPNGKMDRKAMEQYYTEHRRTRRRK